MFVGGVICSTNGDGGGWIGGMIQRNSHLLRELLFHLRHIGASAHHYPLVDVFCSKVVILENFLYQLDRFVYDWEEDLFGLLFCKGDDELVFLSVEFGGEFNGDGLRVCECLRCFLGIVHYLVVQSFILSILDAQSFFEVFNSCLAQDFRNAYFVDDGEVKGGTTKK